MCPFLPLLCVILLISCTNYRIKRENYVIVYANDSLGYNNTIELYNSSYDTIKKDFYLKGDISYSYFDYENNHVFVFGPGGLISIDINKKSINQITAYDVSHVFKIEEHYGYVMPIGINNTKTYGSEIILDLESNTKFRVPFFLNSIVYFDNLLYMTNIPFTEDEDSFIACYNTKGELIDKTNYDSFGRLNIIDGNLTYITNNYYLGKNEKHFFKDPLFSIYDYVDIRNKELNIFSFNYNSMTCDYRINDKIMKTFEDCLGFEKIANNQFIINSKKGFLLFNIETFILEQYYINYKPKSSLSRLFPY